MPTTWTTVTDPIGDTGAFDSRMIFGDFDGDGDIDILYQNGNTAGAGIGYLRNDGGTFTNFSNAASLGTPFASVDFTGRQLSPAFFFVQDFDGDGDMDILDRTSNSTTFFQNNGGSFARITDPVPDTGSFDQRMIWGDWDGDGDIDALYQNGSSAGTGIGFLRNDGGLTFTNFTSAAGAGTPFTGVDFTGLQITTSTFVIDVDDDGDMDFIDRGTTQVLYRNNGNGSFTRAADVLADTGAFDARMITGDFDSDGDTDVLYQNGNTAGTGFGYFRNDGGTFTNFTSLTGTPFASADFTGQQLTTWTAVDIDGDGDVDIVDRDQAGGGLVLFRQNGAPPTLVSSTPSDNGTGVGLNANITLTFSESVTKGNGNIYIYRGDGVLIETISVGSAQVVGAGTTWTIDPSVTLAGLTNYYIRMDQETFADSDGAVFAGISNSTTLNFTTQSTNTAPTFTNLNGDAAAHTENVPVRLDVGGNATVADAESANFDTGTLTVSITANGQSGQDVLSVANIGNGAGQIGVSGSAVSYGGVQIGTFTGGTGGSNLVFTFDADATPAAVQALVRALQYNNTSDAPNTATRTVTLVLTDGDGGTSATQTVTVGVTAANDPHTGGAAITGTAAEDGVLTAVSTLADADGLGTLHYQWQRDTGGGYVNVGSDQSTYTLGDADVGGVVRVVIYYTDAGGTVESATSAGTAAISAVNDPNTGGVSVTGTATEDQVLTADTSTLGDVDGLGTIHYDWQRDTGSGFVSIGAADQATYTLGDADVGGVVRVVISYTDGQGFSESATSAGTAAVAAVNDAPTGGVSVNGTATENQVLTADTSTLGDADGLGTLHYQWQRDTGAGFVNVGSDQATYTLGDADVGGVVRVVVSYSDGQGFNESLTSAGTTAIAGVNDPRSGGVAISGVETENQTLDAVSTLSDPDGLGTLHYDWQRDTGSGFVSIGAADQATYTLGDADVGASVRVVVSYTDGQGFSESATSGGTGVIAAVDDAPTGGVSITGTAAEDSVLTADTSTLADNDGLGTLHYDWQRDTGSGFVSIGAADQATYTLGDADVGGVVRVVVSYTDGQGFANSVTSAASAAVTDVNDAPTLTLTGTTTSFVEGGAEADLFSGATVTNPESGQELTLTLQVSGVADGASEGLVLSGVPITMVAGSPFIQPAPGGAVMIQVTAGAPGVFNIVMVGISSNAHAQQILNAITYVNADQDPTAGDRTITVVSIRDNGGGSNSSTVNVSSTVTVSAVDDAPVAVNDTDSTLESAPVSGSVFGNDSDPDGPALTISAVNGSAANVGSQITLASGALLTVNADGTYTYDPNGRFNDLPGAGSGSVNTATETFTYTLVGGNTATVTITVNGEGSSTGDVLIGSGGDDTQTGGAGNETIVGGAGNDTISGGGGTDTVTYSGAPTGVIVRLNYGDVPNDGFGGTDTISGVENVTGTAFNDTLIGQGGANTLAGGAGYDVLIGLGGDDILVGGAGTANELYGGAGNDVYYSDANDTIVETAGQGIDTVVTSQTYSRLSDNVERLFFRGTGDFIAFGNAENNTIVGGAGNDRISGGAGYDVLIGGDGNDTLGGGSGAANELYGGQGDDTYIIDAYDTIVEQAGQGTDTVRTTLTSFGLGANVENLLYTGTSNFVGRGNDLDNIVNGRTGNDILTGAGGNDSLNGGDGLDVSVLRGVAADYTVTYVSGTTWTITDNVGGRDGIDTITNIERLAFSDGTFRTLTPPPAQPAPAPLPADEAQVLPALTDKDGDQPLTLPLAADDLKSAFDPLVLPVATDDDFLIKDFEQGPQVLPGLIDRLDGDALFGHRTGPWSLYEPAADHAPGADEVHTLFTGPHEHDWLI
jgi:hypothetical protein